ncbi:MAG: transcription elongation factor Spt5 [Candidatus ainarchaeum sp.]|nr:transcription elongation factor Spt5 [Candidatus ainarchaeum sp.]
MLFPVRTTVGQESLVVDILSQKIKVDALPVYSIAVIPGLKGYILIEAQDELNVRNAIAGAPHIKGQGIVKGSVDIKEIGVLLESKPLMKSIKEHDKIEIISGAFKGEKARVMRVNDAKEEVVVELLEAAVKIPVTLKAENIRVLKE